MAIDFNIELISLSDQSQYQQLNALVRSMTPADIATVTPTTIEGVLDNLTFDFHSNQATANTSLGSLRLFCQKFSDSLTATIVEFPLRNVGNGIDSNNTGDYRAVDAITDYLSAAERVLLSQTAKTSIIHNFIHDISEGLYAGNDVLANSATTALRDFMAKFGASTNAASVESELVNIAFDIDATNSSDYRSIDAITDYLATAERTAITQNAKGNIANSISHNVIEGLTSGDAALVEASTSALRNFMSKFGSTTNASVVEPHLLNIAFGIEQTNTGDYRAIDAITDYLSSGERALLGQSARTAIVDYLIQDVVDGLGSSNLSLANSATAALRDFMVKFGATTAITSIDFGILNLVNGIDATNTGNYLALDAITDNIPSAERALLSQVLRSGILHAMVHDISEGLYAANSTLIEGATSALRDYMIKFGATTDISGVEPDLMNIAFDVDQNNTGDYRSVDAMTDYLTVNQRSLLSQTARNNIMGAMSHDVADGLFSGNSMLVENSTAALLDFMRKFGNTTTATSVENHLANLAFAIDLTNAGDYRSIDAITDFLTVSERGLISQETRAEVISDISHDIAFGLTSGNAILAEKATAALDDFMTKTGATTNILTVEPALVNLAQAHAADGLNAVFSHLSSTAISGISQETRDALDLQHVVWGSNAGNSITASGGSDFIIFGLNGVDTLNGSSGNDHLYGGNGGDTLYGNNGSDFLFGEAGHDTLTGGLGADTFVLALPASSSDTVKDFNVSEGDLIDLSNILDFDSGTQTITDYVIITSSGPSQILSVDLDGTGSGAAQVVATLENTNALNVLDLYNNGQIIV